MIQERVNELVQLHSTFTEYANTKEIKSDDIRRFIICTEEFHRNIVFAHEMGLVSLDCVSNFEEIPQYFASVVLSLSSITQLRIHSK